MPTGTETNQIAAIKAPAVAASDKDEKQLVSDLGSKQAVAIKQSTNASVHSGDKRKRDEENSKAVDHSSASKHPRLDVDKTAAIASSRAIASASSSSASASASTASATQKLPDQKKPDQKQAASDSDDDAIPLARSAKARLSALEAAAKDGDADYVSANSNTDSTDSDDEVSDSDSADSDSKKNNKRSKANPNKNVKSSKEKNIELIDIKNHDDEEKALIGIVNEKFKNLSNKEKYLYFRNAKTLLIDKRGVAIAETVGKMQRLIDIFELEKYKFIRIIKPEKGKAKYSFEPKAKWTLFLKAICSARYYYPMVEVTHQATEQIPTDLMEKIASKFSAMDTKKKEHFIKSLGRTSRSLKTEEKNHKFLICPIIRHTKASHIKTVLADLDILQYFSIKHKETPLSPGKGAGTIHLEASDGANLFDFWVKILEKFRNSKSREKVQDAMVIETPPSAPIAPLTVQLAKKVNLVLKECKEKDKLSGLLLKVKTCFSIAKQGNHFMDPNAYARKQDIEMILKQFDLSTQIIVEAKNSNGPIIISPFETWLSLLNHIIKQSNVQSFDEAAIKQEEIINSEHEEQLENDFEKQESLKSHIKQNYPLLDVSVRAKLRDSAWGFLSRGAKAYTSHLRERIESVTFILNQLKLESFITVVHAKKEGNAACGTSIFTPKNFWPLILKTIGEIANLDPDIKKTKDKIKASKDLPDMDSFIGELQKKIKENSVNSHKWLKTAAKIIANDTDNNRKVIISHSSSQINTIIKFLTDVGVSHYFTIKVKSRFGKKRGGEEISIFSKQGINVFEFYQKLLDLMVNKGEDKKHVVIPEIDHDIKSALNGVLGKFDEKQLFDVVQDARHCYHQAKYGNDYCMISSTQKVASTIQAFLVKINLQDKIKVSGENKKIHIIPFEQYLSALWFVINFNNQPQLRAIEIERAKEPASYASASASGSGSSDVAVGNKRKANAHKTATNKKTAQAVMSDGDNDAGDDHNDFDISDLALPADEVVVKIEKDQGSTASASGSGSASGSVSAPARRRIPKKGQAPAAEPIDQAAEQAKIAVAKTAGTKMGDQLPLDKVLTMASPEYVAAKNKYSASELSHYWQAAEFAHQVKIKAHLKPKADALSAASKAKNAAAPMCDDVKEVSKSAIVEVARKPRARIVAVTHNTASAAATDSIANAANELIAREIADAPLVGLKWAQTLSLKQLFPSFAPSEIRNKYSHNSKALAEFMRGAEIEFNKRTKAELRPMVVAENAKAAATMDGDAEVIALVASATVLTPVGTGAYSAAGSLTRFNGIGIQQRSVDLEPGAATAAAAAIAKPRP